MKNSIPFLVFILSSCIAFAQTDSLAAQFEAVEVVVALNKDVFNKGEKVEARILVLQKDTSINATAHIIGWKPVKVQDNAAAYTTMAFNEGLNYIEGYVEYYIGDRYKRLPFLKEYSVVKQWAIITTDATNIIYTGIENPLNIVVPGYDANSLLVEAKGITVYNKRDGKFYATAQNTGKAVIKVSVKNEKGEAKFMGSADFIVKPLPHLHPSLGSFASNTTVKKDVLIATLNQNTRVSVAIDEAFNLSVPVFVVSGYTLTVIKAKGENPAPINISGQTLNQEAMDILKKLESGDKILIDNIQVAGKESSWEVTPFVITLK